MDDPQLLSSYTPDFSDICNDQSTFWDFLSSERKKKETASVEPNLKVPFWDFLGPPSSAEVQTEKNLKNKLVDCSVTSKNALESLNTKTHIFQAGESNGINSCKTHKSNNSTHKDQSLKIDRVTNEDEDEFWDFLKSDCPVSSNGDANHTTLKSWSRAEFEEIKKLSYLSSLPTDEISTSYPMSESSRVSTPCDAKKYTETKQSKHPESDIFSELDLLLSETSYSFKRHSSTEQVDLEQSPQDSENTNNLLNSSKHINIYAAVTNDTTSASVESKSTKSTLVSSTVSKKQDVKMYSTRQHNASQNLKVQPDTEYDTQRVGTQNVEPEKGLKLTGTENNNSETSLPIIISSCYSISSCNDIFDQAGQSINKQKGSEFYIDDNRSAIACSYNSDTKEIVSPLKSNATFESNPNSNTLNACFNVTPTKQGKNQNMKRLLSRCSPKNSIFRITDCDPIGNMECTVENIAPNNATDCKRLKTSDLESNLNAVSQEYFFQNSFSGRTENQSKTVQMQTNMETKNITASNTTPLYFIIPKNANPNQNPTTEFIMIINNNGTVLSNSAAKAPINETNYSFPVTCTRKIMDSQTSTSNQQINDNGMQMKFPVLNVLNLDQNNQISKSSSHLQPMIVCEPIVQPMNKDVHGVNRNLNNTLVSKFHILPNALSESVSQENNLNTYTTSVKSANNNQMPVSQMSFQSIPATSNFQLSSLCSKESYDTSRTSSCGILQSNQMTHIRSQKSISFKRSKSMKQERLKPISSISIGNDKNAIQQISVPLKLENLTNSKNPGSNNCFFSKSASNYPNAVNKVLSMQDNFINTKQQQNNSKSSKSFESVLCEPKIDSVLVKRNLITNESEIVSKDTFLKSQPLHHNALQSSAFFSLNPGIASNSLSSNKGTGLFHKSSENKPIVNVSKNCIGSCIIPVNPTNPKQSDIGRNTTSQLNILEAPKSIYTIPTNAKSEFQSLSSSSAVQAKTALATLQEIFPPPISMIPVCVMQPAQNANKPTVSKVMILQGTNSILSVNSQTHNASTNARSKAATKKITTKLKKMGRKTVRQLLDEKHKSAEAVKTANAYETRSVTKVLKPMYKMSGNNVLTPIELPDNNFSLLGNKNFTEVIKNIDVSANLSKRPNILILPSATRIGQSNTLQEGIQKEIPAKESPQFLKPQTLDVPLDFLSCNFPTTEKPASYKDYKPRYYDMSELSIGFFKVEDDVDSCGKFHCKFKVLFAKRQFIYDFPAVMCNQVDVSSRGGWEQMIRVLVPFKIVEAISMLNRRINIRVHSHPQIFFWKKQRRSGLAVANKKGFNRPADNSIWTDAVQNSLLHKITLRRRQADTLKTNLCQFDLKFLTLFSAGVNLDIAVIDASSFEEEFASTSLRKFNQKNKKNIIRRLPQWDSKEFSEFPAEKDGNQASSGHVCSCRISCKSLRCSCVKAAKSCSTVGAMCLCTGCDNPLNVLESFGLNLDFALSDCCLFQNIYQIARLQSFLQRDVKLSCCNTIARVLDCIPGTILCPNTDCNACLEFSWCRGIVCYPERNPRNHCSFCGKCCFSNGRHCSVDTTYTDRIKKACNRCYVVTPKCPQCPNCKGDNRISQDMDFSFYTFLSAPAEEVPAKSSTKPEIILLDSSFNMKTEEQLTGRGIITTKEIKDDKYSNQNDEKEAEQVSDQKISIQEYVSSEEQREKITTLKVEDTDAKPVLDDSEIKIIMKEVTEQIKCEDSTEVASGMHSPPGKKIEAVPVSYYADLKEVVKQ